LLAKRLTDIPGISEAFPGGIVAYSVESKINHLGVDPNLLKEKGAVSLDVALAMATGARERFGADIGIGITGIAGPDSDDSGLEPGTVFIALTTKKGSFFRSLKLLSDRARIRTMSSSHALDMLRRYLTGLEVSQ
jgi:nicotinamide-nucleotide amidase